MLSDLAWFCNFLQYFPFFLATKNSWSMKWIDVLLLLQECPSWSAFFASNSKILAPDRKSYKFLIFMLIANFYFNNSVNKVVLMK